MYGRTGGHMKKNQRENSVLNFSLPRTSASDLRGKQSVRATFKLTEKAIGALSIVSVHLGIKQKSLFDHLMEDADALQAIAGNIQAEGFNRQECVQKTFVLSRKTLSSLERASKSYNAPRDALVEYSIHRLLPVILREKKRHLRRKEILSDMTDYLAEGVKLLDKTRQMLGDEDPVYERMEAAIRASESAYRSVDEFVERGKIIESF